MIWSQRSRVAQTLLLGASLVLYPRFYKGPIGMCPWPQPIFRRVMMASYPRGECATRLSGKGWARQNQRNAHTLPLGGSWHSFALDMAKLSSYNEVN